jgi:hypothetical protein
MSLSICSVHHMFADLRGLTTDARSQALRPSEHSEHPYIIYGLIIRLILSQPSIARSKDRVVMV